MLKKPAMAAVGALVAATLTACGGGGDSASEVSGDCKPAHEGLTTASEGSLTTATYNFPPFTTVSGTEVGGAEGDILSEIAKMECLDLVGQPLDTGSVVTAAQTGRVDLASGNWYCTAERAKVLNLAGPVYGDLLGILSNDGADTFAQLDGRTVGTVDGYNYNPSLQELYGSNVKIYPSPTAMYADVKSGRVDAAVDSYGSALHANEQSGNKFKVEVVKADPRVPVSTEPGQVCFPIAKSNDGLLNAINDDIETLRTNGMLEKIIV